MLSFATGRGKVPDSERRRRARARLASYGRLVGAIAALACVWLWGVFLLVNPYGSGTLASDTAFVAAVMVGLALAGLAASVWVKPVLMFVVFLASFVPVGLYFLGTPGIFRWIGMFDAAYLLSGLLMAAGRRGRR